MIPRNPDRDYEIINARKSLLAAQAELATKKGHLAALEVQDKRHRWNAKRQLTIVKKGTNECKT